jgi:hypothetical protein
MDPLDAKNVAEAQKTALFNTTVPKIDKAVAAYLQKKGIAPSPVHAGLSPGYTPGAAIIGVYVLAGQQMPQRPSASTAVAPPPLSAPVLSQKGKVLWQQIHTLTATTPQYIGQGAYTGFVDDPSGKFDPVGPCSTVRMVAPAPGVPAPTLVPHPRWLPPGPEGSPLWAARKRADGTYVPWGLIGGENAAKPPTTPNTTGATNLADQMTQQMAKDGMLFTSDLTKQQDEIATYPHGMIQAIYRAYHLGPKCAPYEIAVGDVTKKMASCLPCTLFMHAVGYPPTSIHLGSGLSWAPMYWMYNPNPNDPKDPKEINVIDDLNNSWYEKCFEWLEIGLDALDDAHIAADHKASRDAVRTYLTQNKGTDKVPTVGGVLVLDALTVHDTEIKRISRTLQ